MATSTIPKSKAKTAYGLLSEVVRLVEEEPKRMWMGIWSACAADVILDKSRRPACGTVGCVGGWCEVLVPGSSAQKTLGLTGVQSAGLFLDNDLCCDRYQGTLGHARRVVRHVRRFQKAHETQLRKKKIVAARKTVAR